MKTPSSWYWLLFPAILQLGELQVCAQTNNTVPTNYTFRMLHLDSHTNIWFTGTFIFRHSESASISLYGNGAPSNGLFYAIFPDLEIEDGSEWKSIGLQYCGTGAEQYSITPDKDYYFTIELYGFDFTSKGTNGRVMLSGSDKVFHSDPFDIQAIRNKPKKSQ